MFLRRIVAAFTFALVLPAFFVLPSCSDPACVNGGEGCPCEKATDCGDFPFCTGWMCDGTCHRFNERLGFRCRIEPCASGEKCPGVCDGAGTCIGCLQDADCQAGHTCEAGNVCSSCDDGVRNGDETDVDCGGTCPLCPGTCNADADCPEGYCWDGLCVRCDDGIQNGDETGVDCGKSGGHCPICFGAFCESGAACASGSCEKGLCCSKPCPLCYDCDLAGECFPVSITLQDTYGADPSITCSGNYVCDGKGRCAMDNGQPCTQNNDCASENCINGFCKW